jgi:hypothetical protein
MSMHGIHNNYGQSRVVRLDMTKSVYDEIEDRAAANDETFNAVIHRAIRAELARD